MLRRTPLSRGTTPLRRFTPLVARTPLVAKAPVKAARPKPAVPVATKEALAERSGGWCEGMLINCLGRATDAHHRITQKAGGRKGAAKEQHDRLSNLLHLCRYCHGWVTDRPGESYEVGLSLREGQVPAQEPVLYRGEVSYLLDDGRVLSFDEVGT